MRIDISTARELVNNYKQNHWTIINGSCPSLHQNPFYPAVQDSRSVWFSLSEINSFIQAAGPSVNGIRFYFGEYSTDIIQAMIAQLNPKDPNYQQEVLYLNQCIGLHNLVMIPTQPDAAGISHDFDLVNGTSDFSNQKDLAADNHGELIPPPYYVTGQPPVNVGQDFMLFCDANP